MVYIYEGVIVKMSKIEKLRSDLALACDHFSDEVHDTLNRSGMDDETFKDIMLITTEINQTFHAFANAIDRYAQD